MGSRRVDSSGSSVQNSSSSTPSLPPSNEDIEAVIQMATSARPSPDRGGPVRDTRTQLFVGNLPYRVRWQDLKDLFRKGGTVLRADVSLGPDNRSRGYGTVLLASAEDAGRAVDMFNGYSWQTRILEVRPDRLPPDFDNPTSVNGFASGISNVPSLLGASPFAPAGQNNSSPLEATLGEDVDYSSFYLYDGLGASGAGGRNLFVGNLPFHCQWQDLKDLFRQAGTIIRADVALGQDGRSRGFGTVVFATDTDAEHAVKMFHGYEYNGRQLKVHYDKFSQTTQTTIDPASPTLQPTYPHNPSFGCHLINPPNHIPMPIGYHFDLGTHSGPNSPYGCPPNVSMAQPHSSQAHPVSVDHLSASFASTSLGENTSASDDRQNSSQSIPRHHHNNSNHHHHPHPGPISLPPPPSVNAFPIPVPHTLSPHTVSPLHHPMSPMQQQQQQHHLMTPHGLPPITPSMPPFSFLPQPSPHAHPASSNMQNLNTPPIHSAHVLSTFSPGVAMSPGAFWGRPGGGVNPFINPAVGAPVHGSPGGFFGMNMQPVSPGANMDEPSSYFPPVQEAGYFPPMASSNLANEILRDKSGDGNTPGSVSSGTTDTGIGMVEERTSHSNATSWHTPGEEAQAKETRDAEAMESTSSILLANINGDGATDGGHGIARTSSMIMSGKSADRVPMNRGASDPVPAHCRDQSVEVGDGCSSAGDADGRARERRKMEPLIGLGLSIPRTDS